MSKVESDVEEFRAYLSILGFPPELISDEEVLKAIFKSPQRELLYKMMKRVRPRQEVEAFRRHKLLVEVEKLGGIDQLMIIPSSRRAYLPRELQTYQKIEKLRRKREESEARLEEYRKENDMLDSNLKAKHIQIIKAKNKNDLLEAKIDLLGLKNEEIKANIKQEEGYKEQLLTYMPVKLNFENGSESAARFAVEQALRALDEFYEISNETSNEMESAKSALWTKIRSLFSNIPNIKLFNEILRLKEQQLQSIKELKEKHENSLPNNVLTGNGGMSPFEREFKKAKIESLALIVKHVELVKETERIGGEFAERYNIFEPEFKKKVSEFNLNESEERIDELISDYIIKYNSCKFYKGEKDFLQQEIDQIRAEIEENTKKLRDHEQLIGTVEQIYSETATTVNSVQESLMLLKMIKEKLMYSRDLLNHKVSDVCTPTKSLVPFNVDSFGTSSENFLCSTKLDLVDSPAAAGAPNTNNSLMRRTHAFGDTTQLFCSTDPRHLLPPHSLELTIFSEIPLEKFSCMGKDFAFYLAPNPLVIDSSELSSTLQLAPGILLTQSAALQEVKNRIAWADSIAFHSTDLKLHSKLDLTLVDVQKYKERSRAQRERFTELLDNIEETGIRTCQTLKKMSKLYDFILDNPLRRYIPPTTLLNNQSYAQFEAEFKMFYRLTAPDATTIK